MNFAEVWKAVETFLPHETWNLAVSAWRFDRGPQPAQTPVEWVLWIGRESEHIAAKSPEEMLAKAREVVAKREPDPVTPPDAVQAVGEAVIP